MTTQFKSNDFEHQEFIPKAFSCEGDNISPQLEWRDLPEKVESLALILDDPDSASGTWTHWIIYNIPNGVTHLPRNVSTEELRRLGIAPGKNDFGNTFYQGPCPRPGKVHHYCFHLYALDANLNIAPASTCQEVRSLIQGHVLEETQLIGCFARE
jgi:Raf kinase inhibitor-like YbhB/YbcL family protein